MAKLNMTALVPVAKKSDAEIISPEHVEVLPAVSSERGLVTNAGNGLVKVLTSAISMPAAILDNLFSTANHLIGAYVEIQKSHDQVRIVKAQTAAYVRAKEEETRQVAIQQENETIRFLEKCKTDLEIQRLEYQKFALEISYRREAQLIQHERWQAQIAFMKTCAENLLRRSEKIYEFYAASDFQDKNLRAELRYVDEKIFECMEQIRALSVQ